MLRFIMIACLAAVLSVPAGPGVAKDHGVRLMLKELSPNVRKRIFEQLRAKGVEPNKGMALGITTSDCPSNCNDKVAGGFCYCTPGSGGCPSGTTSGTDAGTGEKYCKVKPDTGQVIGGGLKQPVQVQMP